MIRRLAFLLFFVASLAGAANLLPPRLAFRPSAWATDEKTLEVHFEISEGYYLYRDKFAFQSASDATRLGAPVFPEGERKRDETFGDVEVYYREVFIRIPIERRTENASLEFEVVSQGCAEIGVCFPLQKHRFSVDLPEISAPALLPPSPATPSAVAPPIRDSAQVLVPGDASDKSDPFDTPDTPDESGRIARILENADAWLVMASFFGFGLLLSMTPCVLPMLPILSGIIVGAGRTGRELPRSTGFFLSLAYVLGMATAYATAGALAGLSGSLLSNALQTPWVLGGVALLFVALAFSMFGFYELALPSSLQTSLAESASRLRGKSLGGVAAMGALSALVVAPCVAPPFAGALLYIGQTGNAPFGALALFCMALGMGVPLLAVGASAGALLPKSGPWMDAVNKVFGFVLLGVAHWLVAPFLPASVSMALWSVLLIVPAMLLRAIDPLPPDAGTARRVWKAFGVVLLLTGAALLVGALSGSKNPLQPLAGLRARPGSDEALRFERVHSLAELENRLKTATQPVMLDFYADWCAACKEMERFTFSDARVKDALSGWTLLQADVTANTDDNHALLARFGLFGPPGILFFDTNGREKARVVGFQNAAQFLETLDKSR